MPHPHAMKEIALQAGVSLATVDRVLHQRPGVRASTRRRVEQAQAELRRQQQQVGLRGRRLLRRVLRVTRNDNFYPRLEVLAAAATRATGTTS